MIELPCTKTRLRNLGKSMIAGPLDAADAALLDDVQITYAEAQSVAERRMGDLGCEVTGRAKQEESIRAKLIRLPTYPLGTIQDIAGLRHTLRENEGHREQDIVVSTIESAFAGRGIQEPRVCDRRGDGDSHGYRAVHVIVHEGQIPVEIQVRTYHQHLWADLSEACAEVFGRQIRYGESPAKVGPLPHLPDETVGMLRHLADFIETYESGLVQMHDIEDRIARANAAVRAALHLSSGRDFRRTRRWFEQAPNRIDVQEATIMGILDALKEVGEP